MFSRSRIRWIVTATAFVAASAAGRARSSRRLPRQPKEPRPRGLRLARRRPPPPVWRRPPGAQQARAFPPDAGDWPRRAYAPYYESWETGSIAQSAAQSGSPYETIAFIQAPSAGSCSLSWNGDSTEPIPGSTFAADVTTLQKHGGNVIPSFGGYGADTGGTEIADSCTDINAIAADYESVITTYHVTRLDMDVEPSSLTNTAGIARRNEAIKLVEHWAAARRIPLQIQYTIAVLPTGLTASGLAVPQNAIATGTRIDVLNIMTFDYYLASEPAPLDMAKEAIGAAENVHTQLAGLYPGASAARLWAMEGITLMPGIDDYPGKTEITSPSDAQQVLGFARDHGLALLSPSGQRRLPRHGGRQHLLRHQPEHLGLQPPAGALHQLKRSC